MKIVFKGLFAFWVLSMMMVSIPIAQEQEGPVRVSRVLRVYDGDTFYVEIDGWPSIVGSGIGIRIIGIDTPEIRGTSPCVKEMAYKSREELVRLLNTEEIYLYNMYRGKYFRIVATVRVNGYNVTERMIESGRAVAWDGVGKRPKWECDESWFTPVELFDILHGTGSDSIERSVETLKILPYNDQ